MKYRKTLVDGETVKIYLHGDLLDSSPEPLVSMIVMPEPIGSTNYYVTWSLPRFKKDMNEILEELDNLRDGQYDSATSRVHKESIE